MSRSQQKPNKMRSFEPNMNRTSMCDVQRLFKKDFPPDWYSGGNNDKHVHLTTELVPLR